MKSESIEYGYNILSKYGIDGKDSSVIKGLDNSLWTKNRRKFRRWTKQPKKRTIQNYNYVKRTGLKINKREEINVLELIKNVEKNLSIPLDINQQKIIINGENAIIYWQKRHKAYFWKIL